MDFVKGFFSIEEKRVSALLIFTFLALIFTFVIIWLRGDVPNSLRDIDQTLIWSVVGAGGVTAIDNATSYLSRVQQLKYTQDTTMTNTDNI